MKPSWMLRESGDTEGERRHHEHANKWHARTLVGTQKYVFDVTRRVQETLAGIEGELRRLAAVGRSGRITSREYATEFRRLTREQERAESLLQTAWSAIDRAERIDEDPIAALDEMIGTYGALQKLEPHD